MSWFNSEYHQRGKKNVLGKEYKKGKKALAVVIKDLVNHPNCRDFVAERLCRYLITDEPTKEMKQPIIDAFKKSDGFIPEIHKAAIKVAFDYNDKYKKFQTPENWFIQVAKIADLNWPPSPEDLMDKYELGQRPFYKKQRSLSDLLKILVIILIEQNNQMVGQIILMIGFLQNY